MTSVVYEEKWCRNSLEDLFPMENSVRWDFNRLCYQTTLSGTQEMVHEQQYWQDPSGTFFNNIEKIEYVEFINWDEIFGRENELRPDLKMIVNWLKTLYPEDNPLRKKSGPPFNPFSLTFTGLYTFKTFEGFEASYNVNNAEHSYMGTDPDIINDMLNNRYFEKLFVDGIEYNYLFLSDKIRIKNSK